MDILAVHVYHICVLNKHMRLSIKIVVLENNLLHIQFETIMSHKFSKYIHESQIIWRRMAQRMSVLYLTQFVDLTTKYTA